MRRNELVELHGDAICELCVKSEEYKNMPSGGTCEGCFCENAQDDFALENGIDVED